MVRFICQKSHASNIGILKLYDMIKKNQDIKRDCETITRLKQHIEKIKINI